MKKPPLVFGGGCVGLVGVKGEEGASWDFRPTIAHFSVDACIVIDQFVTNLLNFQPLCL